MFTSADLVEEVQVVVNSVDSSVGRGSGQVRMQTRSGTNQFHGAAFYTNNNSALNTQGWFQNLVGADKSYQNRNQFGGRLGGPIKQNKAFFFVLYDGQRYVEKVNVVSTTLTDPARQGIFRYLTCAGRRGRHGPPAGQRVCDDAVSRSERQRSDVRQRRAVVCELVQSLHRRSRSEPDADRSALGGAATFNTAAEAERLDRG
jgi:hypothetical protein